MSVQLLRRRFTVQQYHQMSASGILTEDDQVELIEGEVIEMAPIGSRHAACVDRLNRLLNRRLGEQVIVRVQNPLYLSENSEPQPDVSLVQFRADFYETGHPQPQDVLLLIEIADTTLEFDRSVKTSLYAGAGITEVWLVDLNNQALEIYREPSPIGYKSVHKFKRNQSISAQAFPKVSFDTAEILG
jgi:Uma2 family endonuclease